MPKLQKPPQSRIDTSAAYVASIITDHGELRFELRTRECPDLVNNFVYLSTHGFYNGTVFHRVVDNFVLQGGEPKEGSEIETAYSLSDEFSTLSHKLGTLSLANAGPNTNSTQFFIPLVDMPWLDESYCAIGQIFQGEDVLFRIKQGDVVQAINISERILNEFKALSWSDISGRWERAMKLRTKDAESFGSSKGQ